MVAVEPHDCRKPTLVATLSSTWNTRSILGRPAAPHPERLTADAAAIAALEAEPGIVRARELLTVELRTAAVGEWLSVLAAVEPAARAQAVHLAARWQWYDVAVATATRQGVFFDYELLYPRPYDIEVKAAATVTAGDFTGLRKLKNASGQSFRAGIVLYDGEHTLPFGDSLLATPFPSLWS